MPVYATPGVYLQPQPSQRADLRLVRTDVAGFVGFAERGPLPPPNATADEAVKVAVRLTSWPEFLATFGGFVPFSYLAYAVRAFFDNGGTTCYVVRVTAIKPTAGFPVPRAACYPLPGSYQAFAGLIDATANPGDSALHISDNSVSATDRIQAGDLVEIESDGVTETSLVIGRTDDTITLARPLTAPHPKDTILSKYPPALVITAISPGSWGNRLKLSVSPLTMGKTVEEFALRVTLMPGPDPTAPVEEEYYSHLSLEAGPFFALDRVNGFSNLIQLSFPEPGSEIRPLAAGTGPIANVQTPLNIIAAPAVLLQGGEDGLSGLTTNDFIGGADDLRGLRILQEIDEVGILCAPDAVYQRPATLPTPAPPPVDPCASPPDSCASPPDPSPLQSLRQPAIVTVPALDPVMIYQALIDQCERLRDRVAILDYPQNKKNPTELQNWKNQFVTRFGAIYYPWLKVPDSLGLEGASRLVPTAGHVAGSYSSIDNQFGVVRPPANIQLAFANDVADDVTNIAQQSLNPYGINAIRSFPGRGIRIWGARSLAGSNDSDWQFIHVRRVMSMIEKSIAISTRWAVFEPNDFSLRRTIAHSLTVFLTAIWRTGGLQGVRPAEGFYVKCDITNNPPAVVDAGQLICEVGIAVAAPMEFIVFEIHQDPAGSSITEP
jgi:Bacteriophage tail sheath protein